MPLDALRCVSELSRRLRHRSWLPPRSPPCRPRRRRSLLVRTRQQPGGRLVVAATRRGCPAVQDLHPDPLAGLPVQRSAGQMVLPIFDRVEPSRLRYLTGSFEEVRRSDIEGVQRALFDVSMLHGWKVTDGREEELVKTVVQTVQRCLRPDLQKVAQIARYNVLLNFRGADTRHGIAYDLYNGLVNAGVSVFKDDTDLPIGEEFGSQLLGAISRSTIYITVLSQGYASSKWCLREVKKMMECRETNGHLVMPIFYGVEFSDVRSGRAFHFHAIYEREKDVAEAKRALRHLGYFGGFHDRDGRIDDGKLTRDVVQQTLRKLRHRFQLDVPEHLLSIDDRVKSRWITRC